jgi:hypothetical protein
VCIDTRAERSPSAPLALGSSRLTVARRGTTPFLGEVGERGEAVGPAGAVLALAADLGGGFGDANFGDGLCCIADFDFWGILQ